MCVCVCVVCFGWFNFRNAIFALSLHPSRSNHHCLNQHKFRSVNVCVARVLKLCSMCIVKWSLPGAKGWGHAHVEQYFFNRHRADLQDPCCKICWTPHRKERTDEVESDHEQGCFNAAHAFAPTIAIALYNLVVITTMMPAQVQTNQKNGTVWSGRTSLRSNGKCGTYGQKLKYGCKNGWKVRDKHYVHLRHENRTHWHKHG